MVAISEPSRASSISGRCRHEAVFMRPAHLRQGGVPALLAAGHEIVGVAPAPPGKYQDKLYGYAAVKGLSLVTDCKSLVSSCIPEGTELIVAAHSHWLISGQCLAKAKHGGIGFHPSLLPRHRGKMRSAGLSTWGTSLPVVPSTG